MTNYEKLVDALRILQDKNSLSYYKRQVCKDAADAIERITAMYEKAEMDATNLTGKLTQAEAQLPKRGEWIHNTAVYGTTTGGLTVEHHYTCSVCGGLMGRKGDKFCYNCGAKMNDSNVSNALDNAQDGPIITPCRGCSDYDGYGGCKSKGGCAREKMMEVQE